MTLHIVQTLRYDVEISYVCKGGCKINNAEHNIAVIVEISPNCIILNIGGRY